MLVGIAPWFALRPVIRVPKYSTILHAIFEMASCGDTR